MIPSLDADVNWELAEDWWNFWVKGKLSLIEDSAALKNFNDFSKCAKSLVHKEICLDEI